LQHARSRFLRAFCIVLVARRHVNEPRRDVRRPSEAVAGRAWKAGLLENCQIQQDYSQ
jgi:hypothetical protein